MQKRYPNLRASASVGVLDVCIRPPGSNQVIESSSGHRDALQHDLPISNSASAEQEPDLQLSLLAFFSPPLWSTVSTIQRKFPDLQNLQYLQNLQISRIED